MGKSWHLNGALGQADVGHGVEGALGLCAGDALQRAQRLVKLHGAALQRCQKLCSFLRVQLKRRLPLLRRKLPLREFYNSS